MTQSQPSKKFAAAGPLAMQAESLMLEWQEHNCKAPFEMCGAVAVVQISGPLSQHADSWSDSYEAITARVAAALASPAQQVLLCIDSPGGVVNGCLETARELRRMARAAGKPMVAFANEHACSAAYALATAADSIALPETGRVGSIGVIEVIRDESRAAALAGLAFTPITSGARKADGLPVIPLADDARAAIQSAVDALASAFFGLCYEHRGLPVEKVAALQAAVYYGQDAVNEQLADQVISYTALLAQMNGAAPQESPPMALKLKDVMAALKSISETDDAEAAVAVKMLKKMAEPDAPPAPPGEEKPKPEEGEGEEAKKSEEPAAAPPAASAHAEVISSLAAQVHALAAKDAAREALLAKAEADAFYASVPHLTPELAASLRKLPLAQAKEIASSLPKLPAVKPAAAAMAVGVRGEGVGDESPATAAPVARPSRLPAAEKRSLDIAMGLVKPVPFAIRDIGNRREMGGLVYEENPAPIPGVPDKKADPQ